MRGRVSQILPSSTQQSPDTPLPLATSAITPTEGGTLIMTLGAQDPPTLDPAMVGDSTSAFVVFQIYSGLVRLDDSLEVQPDLAERWDISEDRRTYTFHLRDDIAFADGTPITSEDVRYSFERAADPDLATFLPAQTYLTDIVGVKEKLAGQAEEISGITVIDERTLSITIDEPKSFFLSKLVHPTSYVVDRRAVNQRGSSWTDAPNGSGAFEIETWEHGQKLILKRNKHYHQPAHLDRVLFLIGAAANNPLVLYEQGKIDVTGVHAFALARVRDASSPFSGELVEVPQLSLSYIGMNVNEPPFDDPKVRQAFALLIDHQKLAEITLHGSVNVARGIIPRGMPGFNPNLPEPTTNISRAKQLIAESKYGSIENLPPVIGYGGGWTILLQDVAEEELGISFEVRDYERFGTYIDALQGEDLPLFGISWIADYPDPENFVDLLFRTGSLENYTDYSNPEVDTLLKQAAVEMDEAKRWELYQEAERRILADAPIIPLYNDIEYMLVKPYVKGFTVTPMGITDLAAVSLVNE